MEFWQWITEVSGQTVATGAVLTALLLMWKRLHFAYLWVKQKITNIILAYFTSIMQVLVEQAVDNKLRSLEESDRLLLEEFMAFKDQTLEHMRCTAKMEGNLEMLTKLLQKGDNDVPN